MPLTRQFVENLFKKLEGNQSEDFFKQVSDTVRWTVMGTHPLAGTYSSKEDFLNHTFRRLNRILKEGVVLRLKNVVIDGATAVVEMESLSTAKNGQPFDNTYCWVVIFQDHMITEVRAYVDSALVQKLIDANEPMPGRSSERP